MGFSVAKFPSHNHHIAQHNSIVFNIHTNQSESRDVVWELESERGIAEKRKINLREREREIVIQSSICVNGTEISVLIVD